MLWRGSAEVVALRDVPMPELSGELLTGQPLHVPAVGVVVGGTALLTKHFEWWRRLIEADFPQGIDLRQVYFVPPGSRKQIEALVAPALKACSGVSCDIPQIELAWGSGAVAQGFCALVANGQCPLVILGAPTDAGWDTFIEVAAPLLGGHTGLH